MTKYNEGLGYCPVNKFKKCRTDCEWYWYSNENTQGCLLRKIALELQGIKEAIDSK